MLSRLAQIGSIAVGRALLQPGWRWSTSIGQLTGDALCSVHHISLVLSGRIRFEMEDGESAEIGPGMLVDVPPGHDAWVVGDEPVVIVDLYGNAGDVGLRTEHQRVVTTVLMSDIVESRPRPASWATHRGDSYWASTIGSFGRCWIDLAEQR